MLPLGPHSLQCSNRPDPLWRNWGICFLLWDETLRLVSSSVRWRWLLTITFKVLCSSKIAQFQVLRTSSPFPSCLSRLVICSANIWVAEVCQAQNSRSWGNKSREQDKVHLGQELGSSVQAEYPEVIRSLLFMLLAFIRYLHPINKKTQRLILYML